MRNESNIFSNFVGRTKVNKTLRFRLDPVNSTESMKDYLEHDAKRAASYIVVKNLIDRYHRELIEKTLCDEEIIPTLDWVKLEKDYQDNKNDEKELAKITATARKEIAEKFKNCEERKMLSGRNPFDSKNNLFQEKDLTDEEKESLHDFKSFSGYFNSFFKNRDRIYSAEEKHGTIAYRLINENMVIHMENIKLLKNIIAYEPDLLNTINENYKKETGKEVTFFEPGGFQHALSQAEIDAYRDYIGYINSFLNRYYQKHQHELKEHHPLINSKTKSLLVLRKMILSNVGKKVIIQKLETDEEVFSQIDAIEKLIPHEKLKAEISNLFDIANEVDKSKLFLPKDGLKTLSHQIYGQWYKLDNILADYTYHSLDGKVKADKLDEKVQKKMREDFFTISEVEEAISYYSNIHSTEEDYVSTQGIVEEILKGIQLTLDKIIVTKEEYYIFKENWKQDKPLNQIDISAIKEYMDANISLIRLLKLFWHSKLDLNSCDTVFYSRLQELLEWLQPINEAYNLVRNYVTRKPYSKDKMILKFDCPQLGNGWSIKKERDSCCLILRKEGKYYLLLMNPKNKPQIIETMSNTGECYEKMNCKTFKPINQMLSKCAITNAVKQAFTDEKKEYLLEKDCFTTPLLVTKEHYELSQETDIGFKKWQKGYLEKTQDEKGYVDVVRKWIEFCYEFLQCYGTTSMFDFTSLLPLSKYTAVSEFYNEVDKIPYIVDFSYISKDDIDAYVENKQAYLFQINCKDFSDRRKEGSKKNLHTLYWEFLFDKRNDTEKIIKLNGGAQLFFREASIKSPTVHKTNSVLVNKRTTEGKTIPSAIYMELVEYFNNKNRNLSEEAKLYVDKVKTSKRMYDIVKDKRYTKDQYEIHIPITINYNANGSHDLNKNVQEMIRQNTDLCTIGLDRGERNLITYCVVNAEGKILEQGSFNKLDAVDYQEKLKQKEQDRQLARKDWKSIENIKELKEGYLSQVVHKLSELMIKYQALVIMEDLNFGFKRGRFGVERQVYQKFEMALLKKLEYLVLSKDEAKATEAGGVLKGYQLAYTPMSLTDVGKQCGCVFYVQPAFTSKIDPTTGFSDIFNYNEYTNSESRKTFFSKMKNIRYDSQKDAFEFTYDYNDYKTYQTFYKTQWTVWTGNPCLVWNNNAKKQECVKVTEELKTLFKKYDIDVTKYNLSEQIRDIPATKDKVEFWSKLLYLFRLAISMRYSVVGSMEDRIISPVRNSDGKQFSTPIFNEIDFDEKHRYDELPMDADANGAYHIALKGQLMFDQIRQVKLNGKGEMPPGTMTVRNADWFKYMQSR